MDGERGGSRGRGWRGSRGGQRGGRGGRGERSESPGASRDRSGQRQQSARRGGERGGAGGRGGGQARGRGRGGPQRGGGSGKTIVATRPDYLREDSTTDKPAKQTTAKQAPTKQTPTEAQATAKKKRRARYKKKKVQTSVSSVLGSSSDSSSSSDESSSDSDDAVAGGESKSKPKDSAALSQDQIEALKGKLMEMLLAEQGEVKKDKEGKAGGRPQKGLPHLCRKHNSKEGCSKGTECGNLHVCRNFTLKGDCKFGERCSGGHNLFESQPRSVLIKHGIDVDRGHMEILEDFRKSQTKPEVIKEKGKKSSAVQETPEVKGQDPNRPICVWNLRGTCDYAERCNKNHCEHPYLWQYRMAGEGRGRQWLDTDADVNEEIEKLYSDPHNDECSTQVKGKQGKKTSFHVNFEKMSVFTDGCAGEVRRLSTPSSVRGSNPFNTRWLWYWQEEGGEWISYDQVCTQDGKEGKKKAGLSGKELEEAYLSPVPGSLEFSTPANRYRVDTERLVQINLKHGTEKRVLRRPVFVSADMVQLLRQVHRQDKDKEAAKDSGFETPIPEHWDTSVMEEGEELQMVQLTRDGDTKAEYVRIENMFYETMPEARFTLHTLYRIQNMELWDKYSRNKTWKRKKVGKDQEEKFLFHGTSRENVDGICQQGFDWRIAGSSVGTRFGKGSYFSTTASFAKDYSSGRHVFVVRVLVGESALGDSEMVKPPPRNPKQPKGLTYDSCVNSLENPTMYVIFEQERAYPEYLIKYKKVKK